MDPELKSLLDRADELLADLEKEYKECLQGRDVTQRARNLTNEVLVKLRAALDHTMRTAWEKYIAPSLSEQDRGRVYVYFPITNNLNSFRSILGRASKGNVGRVDKNLYDFLLKQQPFSSQENRWLGLLGEIANEGKHVRLTPQKRTEKIRRISVSGRGGKVSWSPSHVKYGPGVKIMGAPVDPRTQRIVPTPGVTEQVEIWVSFVFPDSGVDALRFCKEACQKTRVLIEEMGSLL